MEKSSSRGQSYILPTREMLVVLFKTTAMDCTHTILKLHANASYTELCCEKIKSTMGKIIATRFIGT